MGEFLAEAMTDRDGAAHKFTYRRFSGKSYPADLAYDNKESGFRIYFVYNNDFADKTKARVSVFENTDEDGRKTVMEAPYAEADTQAVVRTMIMF